MTNTRSPPSTCCTEPMASRCTVPADRGGDRGLHLHRLDGRHRRAGLDLVSLGDGHRDHPGEGRGDVPGLGRVGPLGDLDVDLDRVVPHPDRAQLAVDGAHHGPHAALVGIADGRQAEDQADPLADPGDVLLAGPQPVQEVQGVQPRDVTVGLPGWPGTPWSAPGTAAGSASPGDGPFSSRAAESASDSSSSRSLTVRPCSALVRNGSGQPPGGSPSSPLRNPITESGMS